MLRLLLPLLLLLAACGSEPAADPAAVPPPVDVTSEKPGDWSAVAAMAGRLPRDSGLLEVSPVAVDLASALGPDFSSFQAAMMTAGPLVPAGPLLVTRSSEAWLVIHPADHAFRAGLKGPRGWVEWQTAGAEVPVPAGFPRQPS